MKKIILTASHLIAVGIGFMLGIYLLPILTAPEAPTAAQIDAQTGTVEYTGTFKRDLKGSDFVHWGEGELSISKTAISLKGKVAPGPAYKLYLSSEFVETEDEFKKIKSKAVQVGDVKTFENFIVPVPAGIDVAAHNTVIIWCESFSQFITAAKYQ